MPDIIREELVELSVMRAITAGLPSYGYHPNGGSKNITVREAFPTPDERGGELDITTLAFGFNSDDGGEPAEMGSNLTRYQHTLVCWVFGLEPAFARRLAHTIKHVVRHNNDIIDLLDFNTTPDTPPVIDSLVVMRSQARHEVNNSVRPWDRYVWTCSVTVRDTYNP